MKTRYLLLLPLFVAIFAVIQAFSGGSGLKYPTGAPAGHTGSPGDGQNCTVCHGGSPTNVSGVLTSDVPATGYVAGLTYNFTVSLTGSGRKGFSASPQNVSGTQLGTLIAGSGLQLNGGGKYVTHTQGSNAGTATWNFQWVAPQAETGPVTMYIARVIGQPNVGLSSLTLNENFSVGIEELLKKETRIYPNPVMNNIFVDINLKNSGNMLAEAYNMNGQLAQVLFDGGLQSGKQTLSFKNNLNPGSYVLRMITPDGTLNRKLLVN
jgi:hypothetical protein